MESIFDREKIYHQMLRQEKKMKPVYDGDCYIETAKCFFSLPEEWEKHKMIYLNNYAYGFILSNKYIWDCISIAGKQGGILQWKLMKYRRIQILLFNG